MEKPLWSHPAGGHIRGFFHTRKCHDKGYLMRQLNPFRRFLLALLSMIALGTAASVGAGSVPDSPGGTSAHEAQQVSNLQSN